MLIEKKSQLSKRNITFLWKWRRIHDVKHMVEFIKGLKGSLWGSQQRSCLLQNCLLCLHFMSQLWYLHSTEMERKLPYWLRFNFSPNLLEYRHYIGFIVGLSYVLYYFLPWPLIILNFLQFKVFYLLHNGKFSKSTEIIITKIEVSGDIWKQIEWFISI